MWKRRPTTIITTVQQQNFILNDPPPVGVDDDALSTLFKTLPTIEHAENIINAARQYRTALELIESRPGIAYQLLISTIETLGDVALADHQPDEAEKIKTTEAVQRQAKKYGLTEYQTNHLALLASKELRWNRKTFFKFLIDSVPPTSLSERDPLFFLLEHFSPSPEDLEKTLKNIYSVRSGSLHRRIGAPAIDRHRN
jgi:hypothetical protein